MTRVKQSHLNSRRNRTRMRATPEGRKYHRELVARGRDLRHEPAMRIAFNGRYWDTIQDNRVSTKMPKDGRRMWHSNIGGLQQSARFKASGVFQRLLSAFKGGGDR